MKKIQPFIKSCRHLWITFFILALGVALGGCEKADKSKNGLKTITVWFHTGRPEEQKVIKDQVSRFNTSQKDIFVDLTLIPEGDYNTQVQAAAAEDNLPDLLDLDGPYLYNYAWKGHLLPLDNLIDPNVKKELLPSIIKQGTYQGNLYAIGTFDSGLGLYASRNKLQAAGIRIPSLPEDAWKADEFDQILAALADQDVDNKVLDLRMDYRGEWYTYAFSPIIQSGGGDLIDRSNYLSAKNFLNGSHAITVAKRIQNWFTRGYIDPNTDTNSFVDGRVALSWCGHWEYPRYSQALGDDLVLLPLPDFGTGSKTGMGSWCWAITSKCRSPKKAIQFLNFLLETNEVLAMCETNGAVPATRKAVQASPLYQAGGPLHLFVTQLNYAVPRPKTPAYPVITSAFQQAFQDIRHNINVETALNRAVAVIDEDIRDNQGYQTITK